MTQQILLFFTSCNGIQEGLTSKKYLQQVPWLLGMEDTGLPKQKNGLAETSSSESVGQSS